MLFDDFIDQAKLKPVFRPLPPIPDTGWRPIRDYPDLSSAKIIAIDVETKELDFDNGPGWARGTGHIVGVSVATDNGFCRYYPIRHELGAEDNLPAFEVIGWLKRELSRKEQCKVGANITYDIGWLGEEGIEVKGLCLDVQFAEALLNPGSRVALERLGRKYVGEGKDSGAMYDWINNAYAPSKGAERGEIYRTPPKLVGYYAESDASLPVQIIKKQWPELKRWGLSDVFYMECELIPLMIAMRREGVTVDIERAKQQDDFLSAEVERMLGDVRSQIGFDVNVNSGQDLAKAFDKLGLKYGKTESGNPSFTADFLAGMHHPFAKLITEIKSYRKIQSTFVRGYILGKNVNGKIHAQFHQMRSDDGGTVSGRFSSSDPNLQNIPSRHPILGPLCRSLFIPDHGHAGWWSGDYKQIEYRFMVHFAVGPGADEIRSLFVADPEVDYHNVMVDIIKDASGVTIARKPAKTINFGLLYGMMLKTLSAKMAMLEDEARPILDAYHKGAPFIKATMDAYEQEAYDKGYVETILGRKSFFDLWIPQRGGWGKPALPRDLALREYGPAIKLDGTHKAINRVLQGSSADQMKMGMLRGWKDGLYDVIGVPRLTVHDELNFSKRDNSPATNEGFKELANLMQTVIPLKIPVLVDTAVGKDWDEAH